MEMLDLPWDLVKEILSRVPTTSLRRLRFTCKLRNALFKDSEFIKKHFDKAAKQNSVLTLSNFRVYSLSVNLNEMHNPSIEFTSKLRRSLNESEQVDISQVFHCNGLLLCSMKESYKTNKLLVVNPFTGQNRLIEPTSDYNMYDRYALGYANNNNNKSYESYKILRFPYGWRQLEIFELKSNSWRVLADISPNEALGVIGRGMFLKGNAYWISSLSGILRFDFAKERFRRFCLPLKLCINTITLSVVREEKLLLLHENLDTRQMEIWVSSKIDDTEISWSNSFTLDLCSQFDHRPFIPMSFVIYEEKKVVVSCGRSLVNKKNNMIHIVAEHNGCRRFDYDTDQSNYCPLFIFSFVPSLVSLNHPM